MRVTSQTQQFWARYTDVPAVNLDTASIARVWKPDVYERRQAVAQAVERGILLPVWQDVELRE